MPTPNLLEGKIHKVKVDLSTCSICKKEVPSYSVAEDKNGVLICGGCLDKARLRKCQCCNLFKSYRVKDGEWGQLRDYGHSCPECIKDLVKCRSCGQMVPSLGEGPNGQQICAECCTHTGACIICGAIHWKDNGNYHNCLFYCYDCFRRAFSQCYRCNNWFPTDDTIRADGKMYCEACYPIRHLVIHSHSYRPEWKMYGHQSNRTFFGVELEVECKDIDKTLRIVGIEKGDRIVKHDGSIRHGFEIVSAPCTLRYHQRRFNWRALCKSLKRVGCASDKTSTCGLHVHMTKLFSKTEELKFSTFMYHHIEFLRTLSRRKENNYCLLPHNIWTRLLKQRKVAGDRYEMINWVNENTVEFRLPRGSLNPRIILATIEFCDAVIHYTREKSLIQIRKESIASFIKWLYTDKRSRSMYSHLIMFCQRHEEVIFDPSKRKIRKIKDAPRRRRGIPAQQCQEVEAPPRPEYSINAREQQPVPSWNEADEIDATYASAPRPEYSGERVVSNINWDEAGSVYTMSTVPSSPPVEQPVQASPFYLRLSAEQEQALRDNLLAWQREASSQIFSTRFISTRDGEESEESDE